MGVRNLKPILDRARQELGASGAVHFVWVDEDQTPADAMKAFKASRPWLDIGHNDVVHYVGFLDAHWLEDEILSEVKHDG